MKRVEVSFPWPFSSDDTRDVLFFGFRLFLVVYVVLALAEAVDPGAVTRQISIDPLLYITIILGVAATIWPTIVKSHHSRQSRRMWLLVAVVVALAATGITWRAVHIAGWLPLGFSLGLGVVVLGYGWLLSHDHQD